MPRAGYGHGFQNPSQAWSQPGHNTTVTFCPLVQSPQSLRLPGTPRAHSKKCGLQSLTLRKGQERQVPFRTGLKPANARCLRQLYSPENVELTKRKKMQKLCLASVHGK